MKQMYQSLPNYLLFDNDHYLEDAGYQAISKAALEDGKNGDHERLALETIVQKPGYIYIYLSNGSEVVSEVFFDDLDITTTSSPIIQVNHY